MTSISSTTYPSSFTSPLDRLQSELSSEVADGTISSSDQSALSGALTDIDTSLKSQAPSTTGTGSSSPGDIKSKIDSLIANEVQSGKLTSNQATELQNVFANTFSQGGSGGPGGGGPGGAGGGPRGPGGGPGGPGGPGGGGSGGPGGASGSGGSSASASSSDSSSSSDSLLSEFLKLVQSSQSQTTSYDSSGQTTDTTSSLVVNYQS
jgi:hypothetical protein